MSKVTQHFHAGDSPEETERKLAEVKSWDKITRTQVIMEREKQEDIPAMTADEAWKKYEDINESAWMRTMCFFYAGHKSMKSGITVNKFGECGLFGNADIVLIVREPGYKEAGFRGWLRRILVKYKLISEYA